MNQSEYAALKKAHEELKALIPASTSALSALRYIERELKSLSEVLPELQPVSRCLYALDGKIALLSDALPRQSLPISEVNAAQKAFIGALDKAITFHSKNQNDPHGVGNAVIAALSEIKTATMEAYAAEQNES